MGLLDDAIREHLELKRRHGADSNEVARQEREILGQTPPAEPAAYEAAAPAYDEPAYDAPAVDDLEAAPADELLADPAYDEAYDEPVEPLAGSPLAEPEAPAPDPAGRPATEIFPGTGELMAAAAESAEAPAPPAAAPAPTPRPAADEDAARTGARRLSDEELAAWRKRLSERADRLAAGRPGGATTPAAGTDPAAAAAPAPTPRPPAPAPAADAEQPPAYWSGSAPATPAAGAPHSPPPAEDSGVPVDFFDAGDAETAFAPEPAPEPEAAAEDEHDVLDETPDFLQETPEHDRMWFEQRPPRDFDFG